VDLTRVLAGPWASQTLADLGAEVIKVERPGRGDDCRLFGPPFLSREDGRATGATSMFLMCNRGKRSLTLDLHRPEGLEVVHKLLAGADVLMENFRVGGMAKLGLDPVRLRDEIPRLIICSVTGYGQTGPYVDRGGYDPIIQAMCGMMSVTGRPPGEPGSGPIKTGPSIVDLFTGLYAVIAIQAALARRCRDGRGTNIDMSLLDCGVQLVAQQAMLAAMTGAAPAPAGNTSNSAVPGGGYDCADGHIVFAIGNEDGYRRMCQAIRRPDLATHPRFSNNIDRVLNRQELLAILLPIFASMRADDLVEALRRCDVPATRVNDLIEVRADPQVIAREIFRDLPDRNGEPVPQIAGPLMFDGERAMAASPPPELGQDTDAILSEIGYGADAIAALRAKRIV